MQSMKKRGKLTACLLSLAMAFACGGCGMFEEIPGVQESAKPGTVQSGAPSDPKSTGVTTTLTETTTTTTTTTEPPVPDDITVNVLAVGDNLVQTKVYEQAKKWAADGTYDFTKTYENIKSFVQAADVAIINQETLICGGNYQISGSNLNFNSPVQLGDAMVDVGFDVFTIANNHMMDKGIGGLESSINYWEGMMQKHDILMVGAYRNAEDQNRIRVRETNGMKIAYLSYTENLNGYTIPATSPIKVGFTSDEPLMERQIKEAKQLADAVIVSAHWGAPYEDTHIIDPKAKTLAKKLVEWGADVIIGTHSHTAEQMEFIPRADGTKGFVFYSLGNFISAQTDNFNMIGEMGGFDLVKHGDTGLVSVENVNVRPVITHYGSKWSNLRLYPYNMYTKELASQHALPYTHVYPETAKSFSMDVINNIINKYMVITDHKDGAEIHYVALPEDCMALLPEKYRTAA